MEFSLDPRLTADTLEIGNLDLCYVGLMKDARFAWLILVPRKPNLIELTDLDRDDRIQLLDEAVKCSRALTSVFGNFDKINTAALGNVVSQLHVHVIGRRTSDPAWPAPVWGHGEAQAYLDADLCNICERLRKSLSTVSNET